MPIRVLIALLIVVSSRAQAESLAARKPWHAVVSSPRPGLPAVMVDLGYPGPYVPAVNTPITLNAIAADVPFDGYIGYHFAVRERKTLDTPVVARARVEPRHSWTFHTFVNVRKWGAAPENGALPREIMIEWRDRSMQVIATQTAGVPPWTTFSDNLLSLRVIAPSSQLTASTAFGGDAYVERADALPDRAQWYAGFASAVMPLETWLQLPRRIREAMLGSGIYLVFFGFAQPNQEFDYLDKAIVPVTFSARPGGYDAPWPYRGSRSMPIATPLSWTAKEGASFVVTTERPYIARTDAAAWVADEAALSRPLPAMTRVAARQQREFFSLGETAGFFAVYRAAVATGAALLISVTAWLFVRRKPYIAIAVAAVLIACIALVARTFLRPPSGTFEHVVRLPITPGITQNLRERLVYGPAPLSERADHSERERTSLTGDYSPREDAEVRTSDMPPSMGLMSRGRDWDVVARWTYRREIDNSFATPTRIAIPIPMFRDFHRSMVFWSIQPPTSRDFEVEGNLKKEPDGRLSCVFALPPDSVSGKQFAVINVGSSLAGGSVQMSWATGTMTLTPTKKDVYSTPSCVIPPAVLREIAAHGGIIELTITPKERAIRPFFRTWIKVQEKKS